MRSQRRDLIAFAVIAGTILSACQGPAARPAAAVSSLVHVVEQQPVASSVPDLGNLDEDIGSVVVVSWLGSDINSGVRCRWMTVASAACSCSPRTSTDRPAWPL